MEEKIKEILLRNGLQKNSKYTNNYNPSTNKIKDTIYKTNS